MGDIFISYRRDDAAAWAGRLHMSLERHFRREQLFMDVDSIQAGLDFAKVIDAEVAKCDVMLVVIGKGWLEARNAAGRRRLDDPGDFVRLEVESALRRDIRVAPVLVDGASLPKTEELPEGMRGLVRRQAWPLSHARFGAESEGLVGEISRHVTVGGGAAAAVARTDWAGEASRLFLYLVGGICLIGAALWVGSEADFHRTGERANPQNSLWFVTLPVLLWAALAFSSLSLSRWLAAPQLLALWIVSAISAAVVAFLCAVVGDKGPERTQPVMISLSVAAAAYIIVSGPALILWRRRKRGG